jgi:hypothetical protein
MCAILYFSVRRSMPNGCLTLRTLSEQWHYTMRYTVTTATTTISITPTNLTITANAVTPAAAASIIAQTHIAVSLSLYAATARKHCIVMRHCSPVLRSDHSALFSHAWLIATCCCSQKKDRTYTLEVNRFADLSWEVSAFSSLTIALQP